jgi:hypothetical protein
MDGRQKPDPQPENENEPNDDKVIDLTQIVEGKDDNDVIDLTEIIKDPDHASEAVVEPEAVVNPEVDALPAEVPDEAGEEIIDLTEVSSAPITAAGEAGAEIPHPPIEDEADEAVIDLVDVATTLDSNSAEAQPDVPDPMVEEAEETAEDQEDVIDLTDVASVSKTAAVEQEYSPEDVERRWYATNNLTRGLSLIPFSFFSAWVTNRRYGN